MMYRIKARVQQHVEDYRYRRSIKEHDRAMESLGRVTQVGMEKSSTN